MNDQKTRLVISGNELYEIDLDCIKRKQEGKKCPEEKDSGSPDTEKNK